jgi:hypothetical protein
MLTNTCPVEIWPHVFSYLYTRDLVILSHCCKRLYDIAEDVLKQRQDLHRLLATFVKDVDRFRLLMMHTGAVIVGNIATSFFAGEVPGNVYCNSLDVVLSIPGTSPAKKEVAIFPTMRAPVCIISNRNLHL